MTLEIDCRDAVFRAWRANARAWTRAVRDGSLSSRRQGTDRAIIDAIVAGRARQVIDIGCGEGWLCRALRQHSIDAVGVDSVPELIEAARAADTDGDYRTLTYAELHEAIRATPFDAAVCNFAVLGDTDLAQVLAAAPRLLGDGGRLLIQTLHPLAITATPTDYHDGWREESWASTAHEFPAAAPWYFRTLSSWIEPLNRAPWQLERLDEPRAYSTREPLSLLLIARLANTP